MIVIGRGTMVQIDDVVWLSHNGNTIQACCESKDK